MKRRIADRNVKSQQIHRTGAISSMVLIVLLVLSSLVAIEIRFALLERRQMRKELDYQQAEQLAAAGLLLATAKLQAEPEYRGEVCEVAAGQLHQTKSGRLRIVINDERDCIVVAQYPTDTNSPFQVTRSRKLSP